MPDRSTTDHGPHYAGSDLEALRVLLRYQRWILQKYRPYIGGRVLEVGAGTGSLALQYADAARRAVLVEPAPNLIPVLRDRVAGLDNVEVFEGTLESWRASKASEGPTEPFDAVLMINVLEHISDDAGILKLVYDLLRPGGALLLFVPACPWLYGSLDALVHHHRRYDKDGLRDLLTRTSFQIEALDYFDIAGVLPWWFTGKVLGKDAFSSGLANIYDRVVVPPMSRIEAFVPPPIGKNLTSIAIRPARTGSLS